MNKLSSVNNFFKFYLTFLIFNCKYIIYKIKHNNLSIYEIKMAYQGIQIHQIRAARSLLDWTQDYLAARTGLSKFSIANLEGGKTSPQKGTIDKIIKSLELAGIEFIEDGVRLKKDSLIIVDGEGWYLRLLDDVHQSILKQEKRELLIEFADETKSPPEVIEKIKTMRNDGVEMRILICEGNTNIIGPLEEYRCIPVNYFENYVSLIYADKIAVCTEGNMRAVIIKDQLLAKTRRNMFDITWGLLPKPKKSTSQVRY